MTILDVRPPDWMREAICSSTDPALFFPPKGGSPELAQKVCRRCPVSVTCLRWALSMKRSKAGCRGSTGG